MPQVPGLFLRPRTGYARRMNRHRSLFALLLSLVLALTGGTMATARGQMALGSPMVICSGYGVVTILVDAQGEPIGTVHPCPDCTLHAAFALPAEPLVPGRPNTRAVVLAAPSVSLVADWRPQAPQARGPPAA